MKFSRQDFEVLAQENLYQGFLSVDKCSLRYKLFAGSWSPAVERELIKRSDAVAVLLYDPLLDAVILIEQFRVGAMRDEAGPWMLELVAGIFDEGESPEQVAIRESQEEAGCLLSCIQPLYRFYLSPGACTEQIHLLLARVDAAKAGGVHGLKTENEDIKVHVLPVQQAFSLLSCGQINNAITLIGLQWLQQNKALLQKNWLATK